MDEDQQPLLARLDEAGRRFKAARTELEEARDELVPVMIEALRRVDIRQTTVIQLSGYTRDRVRVLARENGIDAR